MISLEAIRAAAARIAGAVERTPFLPSQTLSRLSGCELYLKFENLQFTASFKERGALNKLLSLSGEARRRGVIAMSAGNHAQAVAYHAARHAHERATREHLTFVHPYEDPLIIAGQGTVGLEMLEAVPELEILVVPVGGGGLISGIATAAKALKPAIEVY